MLAGPPTVPPVGTTLLGKYRIGRTLGRGGSGVVLEAFHAALDRKVAIKLLHGYVLSDDELVARFEREGRLVARLDSPHVAKVLDAGRLPDGQPFLVMEHLEGHDLGACVAMPEALPVTDVVDYVLQACEGVRAAHAAGIVHRDLKPKNLFCARTPEGEAIVKVLDFGISKVGGEDLAITATQHLLGSPRYMSPEQLRSSRHVDARTDIWSLGVILFELAAKRPPYPASNLTELISNVLTAEAPRLDAVRADVPARLADVVARCLRRSLDERIASVDELIAALAPFGTGRPMQARSVANASLAPAESGTLKVASGTFAAANARRDAERTPERQPSEAKAAGPPRAASPSAARRPRRWLAGGGVAVLVGIAGASVVAKGTPPVSPPQRASASSPTIGPPVEASSVVIESSPAAAVAPAVAARSSASEPTATPRTLAPPTGSTGSTGSPRASAGGARMPAKREGEARPTPATPTPTPPASAGRADPSQPARGLWE
jgi:hypothetical protein